MKGIDLKPPPPGDVYYPDSDGEPMAETGVHVLAMLWLIGALKMYFASRRDMYIIGNIFLYYEEGHPESRRSPDVMVVKGVDAEPQRRSFKTWVEGAAPCVVFEITSKETADEDLEVKRALYERLGVKEYFLFDPLHEYLERPLIGYRLINRKYEPLMPDKHGGLLSQELGLRLVPDAEQLALYEFRTGKRLPAPLDMGPLLEEAQRNVREAEEQARQMEKEARQANEEKRQANEEKRQANEEKRQANEEKRQANEEKQQANEEKRQAEERARQAEQQQRRAEDQAIQADEQKRKAEEQAQQARERAQQAVEQLRQEKERTEELARELTRLRALLPPPPDPKPEGDA